MALVTPGNDVTSDGARNVTSRPLSNAERQRRYREKRRVQQNAGTKPATADGAAPDPAPSTKPKRQRPGGHKPNGSARYQQAKREAEAELSQAIIEAQPRRPRKPSVPYSEEIADAIIERLKNGESLKSICSTDDMPDEAAVRDWASNQGEIGLSFGPRYVRAREAGWLKLADELEDLADGSSLGERRFEPGVVQRHRLQIDTRRWMLSKMLPKVFGDKLDLTSGDKPLQQVGSLDLAKAMLAALQAPLLPAPEVIDVEALPVSSEPGGELP
jgi:hypothetical protein